MNSIPLNLILADDDEDDCLLFNEALLSIEPFVNLSTVNDGEQLMQFLYKNGENLPHAIFLDLNMPRKSGYECLPLIKSNKELAKIKVIMYSTSCDIAMLDMFYAQGALYYLQKPAQFSKLKSAIARVLSLINDAGSLVVTRDNFLISV